MPTTQKFASIAFDAGVGSAVPAITLVPIPDADRFFDADYTPVLADLVCAIVAAEAPITEAALARRIAQDHGWQRTGTRIQARVAELHDLLDSTLENETRFFWPIGAIAARVPFKGLSGRNIRHIREISRTEIASVQDVHALRLAQSDDPILELSRLLGISRLTSDTRSYLEECRAWQETTAALND